MRSPVHTNVGRNSLLGLDLKSGNVTVGLDGNALNSFTTQPDIGRYVAYVLVNLPRSRLEWRTFRIEAERKVRKIGHIALQIGELTHSADSHSTRSSKNTGKGREKS